MFWNVAGLNKKDADFWKGLGKWDVIVLVETWLEEKGWRRIKNRLPEGYVWGGTNGKKGTQKREG